MINAKNIKEKLNEIMNDPEEHNIYISNIEIDSAMNRVDYNIKIRSLLDDIELTVQKDKVYAKKTIAKRCECCEQVWIEKEWEKIEPFEDFEELYNALHQEEVVKPSNSNNSDD